MCITDLPDGCFGLVVGALSVPDLVRLRACGRRLRAAIPPPVVRREDPDIFRDVARRLVGHKGDYDALWRRAARILVGLDDLADERGPGLRPALGMCIDTRNRVLKLYADDGTGHRLQLWMGSEFYALEPLAAADGRHIAFELQADGGFLLKLHCSDAGMPAIPRLCKQLRFYFPQAPLRLWLHCDPRRPCSIGETEALFDGVERGANTPDGRSYQLHFF